MKNLTHYLIDSKTGKVLNISLRENRIQFETGNQSKLKTTEKEFSDAEEARKKLFLLLRADCEVARNGPTKDKLPFF
ncbi:MAG TPA: hypothetical protein VGD65_07575, partial [Chryseosolibacter sp.]